MSQISEAQVSFQCRHIFTDGHRCGSKCLRKKEFCFYHDTNRPPIQNLRERSQIRRGLEAQYNSIDLPLPEDRSAIQAGIGIVLQALGHCELDMKRAGLMLYGLQIASLNLPKPALGPTHTVEDVELNETLGPLAPELEYCETETGFRDPENRGRSFEDILLEQWEESADFPNAQRPTPHDVCAARDEGEPAVASSESIDLQAAAVYPVTAPQPNSFLPGAHTLTSRLSLALLLAASSALAQAPQTQVFGFRDFSQQAKWDATFLAVPDPVLAGQHLKTLTKAPHIASTKEDYDTVLYVAEKFKAAGLETTIVPYKVLLNFPKKILIEAFDANGKKLMTGPSPEHVGPPGSSVDAGGDPFQDDPRVTPAFNGASPSGDVTAEVVYANYGTPADFKKLADLGVQVAGKIVLVRYGSNYRGIKVYDAQKAGAAGVLIYSDPQDDGYFRGDMYPKGPYRPASAVQRGATQFLPIYSGDATTPGIASDPDLPDAKRIPADKLQSNWPSIPVNPLSYMDASPILQALAGPSVPHDWQGALPFAYHTGQAGSGTPAAKVTVHMHLEQDTKLRTIWNVVGTIEGTDPAQKDDWVVAGNHRDAWVYGAVDPNSGTAAMLETVHGLGTLLEQGWKPRRRVVICSWDAEEEGLIGSTEWVEGHMNHLDKAVAYFNTDVGVSGPNFNASAVPSLMQFVREVTRGVPSPAGGTVYDQWLKTQSVNPNRRAADDDDDFTPVGSPASRSKEVRVGTLGSGSDFTPFLQHAGVPSTDVGSGGPYGVYHSVFDNYNWFIKNADPTFVYEQQMARVFGLEILHMADTDILPYDYEAYARAIAGYISAAEAKAKSASLQLDFSTLDSAASRFTAAGSAIHARQASFTGDATAFNQALRAAEEALLNPAGLPRRDWYKHTIYAPGEFTGYAAVVIPGVNEGIEAKDTPRTQAQITALAAALNRAAAILEAQTH